MLGFHPLASAPLADDGITVVAITASNVQASAPTLGSPALTQVHNVSANDVDASSPTLGTPIITQVHNISLDDVTSAGTVDSVSLIQNHFVGPSLTGSSPTIGAPVITQVHNLAPSDVDASSPTLDTPVITQLHVLAADDVTSAGTVDSVTLVQNHFVGPSLTGSSPTIGVPTLTQDHVFTVTSVVTSDPTIDATDLTVIVNFSADDITAADPTVDTITFIGNEQLTANDVTTLSPFNAPLVTVPDYTTTAQGLFNSVTEFQVDRSWPSNSGNQGRNSTTPLRVWRRPTYANNLSVNSTGVNFRLWSEYHYIPAGTGTGTLYITYYYNDITLNWSGTVMTLGTSYTASGWPSSTGRYDLTSSTGLANFVSAIDTAVSNANLGSTVYDWIPSKVTVQATSSSAPSGFTARVAGSNTDLDTYYFLDDSGGVTNGILTNINSSSNNYGRINYGYVDTSLSPTHEGFYTYIGNRFVFGAYGADPNSSNLDTDYIKNAETGFAAARFDRTLQYTTLRAVTFSEQPAFTPADLLAGAPTLGTPLITQAGGTQQPSDITATSPTIGSVDLSEAQDLGTVDVTTAVPTLDTVDLTGVHSLGAQDLTTNNSTISSPNLGIVHVLSADDVTSTPTIDSVTITEEHDLTITGVSGSSATIGQISLTQSHTLTAANINATPTVDAISLSLQYNFIATDIDASAPTLGSPVLAKSGTHAPLQLRSGAVTIDSPSITQVHSISTVPVVASSTIDTVDLTQVHLLAAADIVASSTISSPAAVENQDLSADSISTGAATVGTPVATVVAGNNDLTPSDIVTGAARIQYNLSRRRIVNFQSTTGEPIDEGGFTDLGVTGTFSNSVEVTGIAA